MKFQGAVVKEQGVTFAVVVVEKYVLSMRSKAQEAAQSFSRVFPGVPVILMAQDSRGVPTYRGRRDIVRFLANIDFRRLPWKEYTVSA
jgi:hypothetical protein